MLKFITKTRRKNDPCIMINDEFRVISTEAGEMEKSAWLN